MTRKNSERSSQSSNLSLKYTVVQSPNPLLLNKQSKMPNRGSLMLLIKSRSTIRMRKLRFSPLDVIRVLLLSTEEAKPKLMWR